MIVDGILEPMELARLPYRRARRSSSASAAALNALEGKNGDAGMTFWRVCSPRWSRITSCWAAETPTRSTSCRARSGSAQISVRWRISAVGEGGGQTASDADRECRPCGVSVWPHPGMTNKSGASRACETPASFG